MMALGVVFLSSALFLNYSFAIAELSDSKIKEAIIEKSIRAYSGSCPCPFNTMRNGRRCGKRSAYSRPGGKSPICYLSDVTPLMIEKYRSTYEK